jgi:hypothetical protein
MKGKAAVMVAVALGVFAFAVSGGHAFAQTPTPSDIIPSTWTFADLTGAIAAIANLDVVKLTFFGLLALGILIVVAMRLKRLVKAGR